MGHNHGADRDRHVRDGHRSSSHKKAKKSHREKKRHHRRDDDDVKGKRPSDSANGSVPHIGDDDYFLRATEFRVWLKQRRDTYLEELSTDEAARLFQTKFVPRWNSGRLDRMYYDGIPESVLETTKRTRHAWGFVKKLNDRERMDLATAKDSVGVATRKADLLVAGGAAHTKNEKDDDRKRPRLHSGNGSHNHDDRDDDDDDQRRRRRRMDDTRSKRKHHDGVMEEFVPRETGREALLEKRRQVGDKVHGAARDRDANRDGLDLDDAFLMGGGNDNLQRKLAHRSDARQRRDDELRERAAAAQAKETARMDKFLEDMGISGSSGRPITIQPRRDA